MCEKDDSEELFVAHEEIKPAWGPGDCEALHREGAFSPEGPVFFALVALIKPGEGQGGGHWGKPVAPKSTWSRIAPGRILRAHFLSQVPFPCAFENFSVVLLGISAAAIGLALWLFSTSPAAQARRDADKNTCRRTRAGACGPGESRPDRGWLCGRGSARDSRN